MKDEELNKYRNRLVELQEAAEEAQSHSQLHLRQIQLLQEEIRKLERGKTRETENLEYLKNIVLKYMETNDTDALLPVIGTILHFSPEEKLQIQRSRKGTFGNWKLWG